jgi:hypothetical protein
MEGHDDIGVQRFHGPLRLTTAAGDPRASIVGSSMVYQLKEVRRVRTQSFQDVVAVWAG